MDEDQLRALKTEYEAGSSLNQLARKYGLTVQGVKRRADLGGWMALKPPSEEKVLDTVKLFSFDPEEQQILSAAAVVTVHRKDVARLRSIANTLVERLGLEMSGQLPQGSICRGSRESPADLLEKLSRVLVRTTEIERQAYGLKHFDPDQAASDQELQAQLDELTEEMERIALEKSTN
jgi:hypothetical protein